MFSQNSTKLSISWRPSSSVPLRQRVPVAPARAILGPTKVTATWFALRRAQQGQSTGGCESRPVAGGIRRGTGFTKRRPPADLL